MGCYRCEIGTNKKKTRRPAGFLFIYYIGRLGIEPTRYLYRRILSYPSLSPLCMIANEDVYCVYKKPLLTSIMSIISMLWYPICTQTAHKTTKHEEGRAALVNTVLLIIR